MAAKRKIMVGKQEIRPREVALAAKRKLNKFLRDYNDNEAKIAELKEKQEMIRVETNQLMNENGIRFYENGLDVAEYQTKNGRASSTVDVRGFRNLVKKDDDFYGAISVTQANAKKLLSTGELKSITTTIPAKKSEPIFTIFRRK